MAIDGAISDDIFSLAFQLMEAFEDNPRTRKQQLSHKLLQVSTYLETEMETSVENFDNSALLYWTVDLGIV